MIALDTNILARAIAAEIDADAATKAQGKRAQALSSSGRQPLSCLIAVAPVSTCIWRMAISLRRNARTWRSARWHGLCLSIDVASKRNY